MAILQFNLHEGLASYQLGQAIRIAPALREVIEDYRAEGLNDREIVQIIARVIDLIDEERETEKGTKQ